MALIDADYFNLNMAQLGLKASFSPKAEQLDQLIAEASEWVQNYLRRQIESGSVTEVVRGNNSYRLLLREYPVTQIASIAWQDDYGSSGTIDVNDVRILDGGILEWKNRYNLNAPFLRSITYTVNYTAGYSTIPNTIKRATALKIVQLFSPQYQGPREAREVEFVNNLDGMIIDLLEAYRRDRIY